MSEIKPIVGADGLKKTETQKIFDKMQTLSSAVLLKAHRLQDEGYPEYKTRLRMSKAIMKMRLSPRMFWQSKTLTINGSVGNTYVRKTLDND